MLYFVNREVRQKWDSKADEGIFLGYSANSRAYRVFNNRTHIVMESINVTSDDATDDDTLAVVNEACKTVSLDDNTSVLDNNLDKSLIAPLNWLLNMINLLLLSILNRMTSILQAG